ncbi:hypothetical protein ILUMI_19517, partial [Ignelater luminosus]
GDSGGPLQTVSNEGSNSTYNIVGITSVGKKYVAQQLYQAYTQKLPNILTGLKNMYGLKDLLCF